MGLKYPDAFPVWNQGGTKEIFVAVARCQEVNAPHLSLQEWERPAFAGKDQKTKM